MGINFIEMREKYLGPGYQGPDASFRGKVIQSH